MKRLPAALTALCLALGLCASVMAYHETDTDPPLWQQFGYGSQEEALTYLSRRSYEYDVYQLLDSETGQEAQAILEQGRWKAAYVQEHPEEVAAFDPDAWFQGEHGCCFATKEEYIEFEGLEDLADLDAHLREEWLNSLYTAHRYRALGADYAQAHPEEAAAFDADAYYRALYQTGVNAERTPEEYRTAYGLTEEDYRLELLGSWSAHHQSVLDYLAEEQAYIDAYFARRPEKEQEFDLEAWYPRIICPDATTPEERAAAKEAYKFRLGGLTEEAFRIDMLSFWVMDQRIADEDQAVIDAYAAEYPERVADFDPEAWLTPEGYGHYGTKEDYMRLWRLGTQEEFTRKMLRDYIQDQEVSWYSAYNAARWDGIALRQDLGGQAVEVAVTINGQPLELRYLFKPFAVEGVIYVPAADLTRAFGTPVAWWSHNYAKLRPAAEAAGYTVAWDQATMTASLTGPGAGP